MQYSSFTSVGVPHSPMFGPVGNMRQYGSGFHISVLSSVKQGKDFSPQLSDLSDIKTNKQKTGIIWFRKRPDHTSRARHTAG